MDGKNIDDHLMLPENPKLVNPDYFYEFEEQIQRVLFSPYEYSQEIMLVAHTYKIVVALFIAEVSVYCTYNS